MPTALGGLTQGLFGGGGPITRGLQMRQDRKESEAEQENLERQKERQSRLDKRNALVQNISAHTNFMKNTGIDGDAKLEYLRTQVAPDMEELLGRPFPIPDEVTPDVTKIYEKAFKIVEDVKNKKLTRKQGDMALASLAQGAEKNPILKELFRGHIEDREKAKEAKFRSDVNLVKRQFSSAGTTPIGREEILQFANIPQDTTYAERVADTASNELKKSKQTGNIASQRELKHLPNGDGTFTLSSVDEVTGQTIPILNNGQPVILTEKEVLIAEGKKAQSLIDPFDTKLQSEFGRSEGKRLSELKTTALNSKKTIRSIDRAFNELDEGIYSGTAANTRLKFEKFLKLTGFSIGSQKIENTETYMSVLGGVVAGILSSGAFGAGVAISNKDLEFVQSMAGGNIALDENSLREILRINKAVAETTINEFNSQMENAKQSLRDKDPFQPIELPKSLRKDETGNSRQDNNTGNSVADEILKELKMK